MGVSWVSPLLLTALTSSWSHHCSVTTSCGFLPQLLNALQILPSHSNDIAHNDPTTMIFPLSSPFIFRVLLDDK